MNKNQYCPITGKAIKYNRGSSTLHYTLSFGVEIDVVWCADCYKEAKGNSFPSYIVKGMIANNKLPESLFVCLPDCELKIPDNRAKVIYSDFFKTVPYPKTASEKMNNLLQYCYELQFHDGGKVELRFDDGLVIIRNYFKNDKEFRFYLEALHELGFIKVSFSNGSAVLKITHKGLDQISILDNNSQDSKICFVAMAFSDETTIYRDAIKKALSNNNYDAVIIDEEHLESDKTIPDAILNEIRKAKFCIADFTKHRNGVYFESGYALGLGKQVIYTCQEDDFENAHFDIKQLQHVLYSSAEDLTKKLTDKIEFWIK